MKLEKERDRVPDVKLHQGCQSHASYLNRLCAGRNVRCSGGDRERGRVRFGLPKRPSGCDSFVIERLSVAVFIENAGDLDIRWHAVQEHELLHDQNRVLHLNKNLHKITRRKWHGQLQTHAHLTESS